jgi:ABC-type uncharacterized transport system ATPase subunit
MSERTAIEMKQIVKRFGSVMANDHVDFHASCGEIHALLGENGAGKSTIMSILSGLYKEDSGEIGLYGKPVKIGSPKAAIQLGIGIVHQHFRLVPSLTALENILLSERQPIWQGKDWKKRRAGQIAETARQYGLEFPLDRPIWQLSIGEQQRVEIIKILLRGASIILLDEPTSVLTPVEAEGLYLTLKRMKEQDKTVIVSTHKLKEVMQSADRISVMRKGRMISTMNREETDIRSLSRLMLDQEMQSVQTIRKSEPGAEILKVEQLQARGDHGHLAINGLDLHVRQGEIVGIAGVAGNGQKELAEVLTGLRTKLGGTIIFKQEEISKLSIRDRIESGISHVPENRLKTGLAGSLGSIDNLLFKSYRSREYSVFGLMKYAASRKWSEELIRRFDVRTPDAATPVRQMSGGNQQKLLFAREVTKQPSLMVAMHPTQGLDVGAAGSVHRLLCDLRDAGSGVLLISEDLDELLTLSDRILIIYNGRIAGSFDRNQADLETIGMMMAGIVAN